ncbi:MAG: YlxR family protein [Aphanocapsa feldmannii 277cV]|uniref:YlxR family protein n=2 Tax=Aphanocapsa feldmannii TaxID=192050 RepID=A0A524RLZ1_9CHRO|nr:MAG: YlxR family protein [Aphanocapsa feldmannii 288cV]TGG91194.1 MAG: YlxR family protein [Aphanocapsa feldmannii 277cV]TGH27314.1 MAG: YlxR family protein [Aphanocapsa feldmannii 277cI]
MSARPVLRRCVACRCLRDRDQLWRVIRLAVGGVALDRGFGRSAYLCPDAACLEDARKRRRLQRALRCNMDDVVYQALESRLQHPRQSCGRVAEAR